VLTFYLALVVVSFWQFCDFSLNKSFETYLGTMLPPGGRNGQLILPRKTKQNDIN
jgi:hypothetical protein